MNYTIGQLVSTIAIIAGVIGSLSAITAVVVKIWKWISKKGCGPILEEMAKMETRIMNKMIENDTEINQKIDGLGKDIKTLDINQCKDVIISYISALEQGKEIDPVFEERAYEAMDRYTNVLKQNSYIHKRWVDVVEAKKQGIKE